jgi:hypothetical protein
MAINYASKYSSKVDERFNRKSLSKAFTNTDYDWTGVDTVNKYSISTSALNDYSLTGTSRYGTPANLENTVQTMLLTQDKSFTFVIDSKSENDTMGAMKAGKALARQIDEVIVPFIDTYVFAKMVAAAVANDSYAVAAITTSNAYEKLLDGQAKLGDALVPEEGRILGVSYAYYKFLRLDTSFNLASDIAMKDRVTGAVGDVDGMPVVRIPSSRLRNNTSFIIAHPAATIAPMKLEEYKTHLNPPGINGTLVEGRVRFDAFVSDAKVDAIYVHAIGVIS